MVKTLKKFSMVLIMAVIVISFSIPFMVFPSKVYGDITIPAVGQDFQGGIVAYKLLSGDAGYSDGIRALIASKTADFGKLVGIFL